MSVSGTPGSALTALAERFEADVYLRLGGVEEAFTTLEKTGRLRSFLAASGALFSQHGFGRELGVFLLHRHLHPQSEKIPLEVCTERGGARALVTEMRESGAVRATPTRWKLVTNENGTHFQPLEFSTDLAAQQVHSRLQAAPDMLAHFAALLQAFDLVHLLGLTIAERGWLPRGPNETLREETIGESSVLQVRKRSAMPKGDVIPTVWIPDIVNCWCDPQYECDVWCIGRGEEGHEKPHKRSPAGYRRVSCV